MMVRRLSTLAPVLIVVGGCAPSARQLAVDRQYPEAICAATVFSHDRANRDYVLERLERDAEPAVHLYAVTEEDLVRALGEGTGRQVARRALILRVMDDRHQILTYGDELDVELSAGRIKQEAESQQRETYADLTGESLPEPETHSSGGGLLDKVFGALSGGPGGVAAGLGEALTFGVIPLTEIYGYDKHESWTEYPGDPEFLRMAPAAEMLYQSTGANHVAYVGPEPRTQFFVFAPPPSKDVRVDLTWHYRATSYEGECELSHRIEVTPPPGPSLAARINGLFGRRMMKLSTLQRSPWAR